MDYLTVRETVLLRSQPINGSAPVELAGGFPVRVYPEDVLIKQDEIEDGWSQITIDRGGGVGPTGYIKTNYVTRKTLKPKDIAFKDFTALVASAGVAFDIDLAYLLALARVETGQYWDNEAEFIKSDVYSSTGATGPFQFIQQTWDDLVRLSGASLHIRSIDILNPSAQAAFAAHLANEGINRYQVKFGSLPSPSKLYLYHFFGSPAATSIFMGRSDDRIDALLFAFYNDQAKVNLILDRNRNLLTSGGLVRTLDGVLDEIAGRLFDAYSANAPLLADPESWWPLATQLPAKADGPSPWIDTAIAEIGQTEQPGPLNNSRISEYLMTVGFGAGRPDETAWCAAFVCWCLEHSGDDLAINTAKKFKSSFAADWLKLPKHLLEPVPGAIAVTKPFSSDTTGHVGFVKSVENGMVTLLAGNQRPPGHSGPDQVCEREFARSEFVGFRWVGV